MNQSSGAAPKRRFNKGEFFRLCRIVHGWLSAFAFLILCFFSVTGILLNHPGWLVGKAPAPVEAKFVLDADELAKLRASRVPAEVLAEIAAHKVTVAGDYSDGDKVGSDVFVRLQGVRGSTDLRANLNSGAGTVVVERARTASVLNELHRGEHAGTFWRWSIDAIAIILILMSIIGYLIFLSLRFRLRTALLLTAGGVIAMLGIFAFTIP